MGIGIEGKTAADLLGVPAPAKNARDRLMTKAIDLFYEHGFNAVGLDRILDEVGVTKTTFYKHFESKDDLIVAALNLRDEWEGQALMRAVEKVAGNDPRAKLLGFLDVFDVWFNDPTFRGCIFLNAAAEFPNPHDPVHKAAAVHKHKSREIYRDLCIAAGGNDAEAFADRFAMLVEGALIMRHVYHRNDAAATARVMAEQLMSEFIPLKKPRDRSTRRREPRRRQKAQRPARA